MSLLPQAEQMHIALDQSVNCISAASSKHAAALSHRGITISDNR